MIHTVHLMIRHLFPQSRLPVYTFLVKIFHNLFPAVYKGVCETRTEACFILSQRFHITSVFDDDAQG